MTKQTEMRHVRWDDVPVEHMNPLFDRQFVVGDQIMVARISMKKGCTVPEHSHHNEQVTQVVSGEMRFAIDGKVVPVGAGESIFIPSNMPHGVLALEADAVSFDIFTPPRQDWIDGTDQYLRK